ncbi:MAG: hypothetical protein IK093_04375, partial [Ruminiclostridium sp.]|nr:hypothetical protein [Ruminiclostridium sp.]
MYNILLIIQYVNIIALFTECVIVFRNWKNYLHGWLFLCNVVQLVNAVGILGEYTSHTVGAYVSALRISYLGRVWVALFMFFFVLKLCGKKIPKLAALALVAIHAGIFVSVFTIPDCKLYYTKYVFYLQGGFAHFAHSNGIVHHLYTGIQILYIV